MGNVSIASGWLAEATRQLEAIAQFPDGWDSHGGARPDPAVFQAGSSLLVRLTQVDETLPKPEVYPTPSGWAQFSWESATRYFEIELLDSRNSHYYFLDRLEGTEDEGNLLLGDPLDKAVELVRRVVAAS